MRFLDLQIDEDIDPGYRNFLDHLREDGNSYILEMSIGDHGLPACVKYERECVLPDETLLESQVTSGDVLPKRRRKSVRKIKRKTGTGCSKLGYNTGLRFAPSIQFEREGSPIDECYRTFLSLLKIEQDSMVLEYENGLSVKYEQAWSSAESADLFTETSVCSREQKISQDTDPQTSDITVYENENCVDSNTFRRKLGLVIDKPYDQNEYEELLKRASERKPVYKQRHLRGNTILYATKEVGLSYLDNFDDLAEQINSSDCYTGLTLLRGLFFWLENLCHEGSFMPWTSPGPKVGASTGHGEKKKPK